MLIALLSEPVLVPFTSLVTSATPLPLTPLRLFTAWVVDLPMLATAAMLVLGYLRAVRRATVRGVAWSPSATRWFLGAGVGSLVLATMSSLGAYDRVLFWPLAIQDVLLLTFVPVGLTLGRPIAIWRAGRPERAHPPRCRRLLRLLSFPLLGSMVAVTVLLLIYTTGWDLARLEHPPLMQFTRVLLVVAGCGFVWPLLGVDASTGQTSYPVRAFIAFVDGLLDAIPGLAVLGSHQLIAGSFYAQVGRTWGPTLAKDQQIGGTAMIALSELVGLPTMLVLVLAWVRDDERQARVIDQQQDTDPAGAIAGQPEATGSPDQQRPWWETNPGPLADRAERYGWAQSADDVPVQPPLP